MTLWFVSDTHFGHAAMVHKFTLEDGSPARKFSSVEEMDETMVQNWNAVVKPSDHVYHLGDVAMKKPYLQTVLRLNGHKRLVRGNHDIFDTKDYLEVGFKEIHGCRVLNNMMFTHIPIHPECMGRFKANVHGHIHTATYPFPYINICVEQTGYSPVSLEELQQRWQDLSL